MLTKISMLFLLVFLGALVLYVDKRGKGRAFFDVETTNCMRGFWCIIILLVHIPVGYQNPIQDALGSFAYIGVTFFFMSSGYGLTLALLKKPEMIKQGFWKRRLPKILVPMVIVNILRVFTKLFCLDEFPLLGFVSINGFVKQLLFFYLIFWLVFRFSPEKFSMDKKCNILYAFVIATSLLIYFWKSNPFFGWSVEAYGFAYGVLLARKKEAFVTFAKRKWLLKCGAMCIASLILGVTYLKFKSIVFLGDYLVKILLGFSILAFILVANVKFSIGNVASRFLGGISYEVYLIHDIVFIALAALFGNFNSGLFVLGSIVCTAIVSVLVKGVSDLLLKNIKFKV